MANQKGGVGKTTTSCNLAAGLARGGLRTLLLDLDPQCNATTGFGATPAANHPLVSEAPLSESVVETGIPNLSIIPGSRSVRDVERIDMVTKADIRRVAGEIFQAKNRTVARIETKDETSGKAQKEEKKS